MVRETRHLWVGNLPDNVREERIREHFQRYGRVQSVKLLPRTATSGKDGEEGSNSGSGTGYCAAVAFMDIKSAAKAHASENSLDDRCLVTDYYEPLLQDQSRTSTPTGSTSGGVNSASTTTPSSSRSHVNNSVGGYDRPSSHYFERRGDPHSSDGSGFLRRQAPVNHHGGYNNHRGSYRSSNGPPFSRDPERGGSSSYRGGPPYSTYGDPPGSGGGRYQPPPDYSTVQDERADFVSGSSSAVSGGTPKRTNSSNSSSVIGPLPGSNLATTPLSTRKRKSSRSPSRSRSGSADSRTPPSSRSRSRSRSQSPTSSASVPSGRGGGSRCSTRSTSPGDSQHGGRTLSPTGIRADGDDSRSSSRSSNNSSPHSQTSRTGKKTPHSAQSSSSPRSSRSSQGSSRSPGWLSTSATHSRSHHHHHGHRSSRHRLVGATPVTSTTSSCHTVNNSSSPAGQMCHLASEINSNGGGEMRRPLAICVRNLPLRSSDTSLKDGLFHEYKKHGKVVTVKVAGQGSDRVAIVRFKKAEDVEKALEVSRDKLFFGCKIEVTPWDSGLDLDDNEFRPLEADLDEYHPKATRTLFIGNLEKDVTSADLRAHFETFGPIIEIDIKKQSQGSSSSSSSTTPSGGSISSSSSNNNNTGNNNAYAFCQYADIASVVRAMRHLDGEQVGNTRVKLGFGKSMPTNCVWLHGIADTVAEKFLARHMSRFGHVSYAAVDRERCNGLVFYDQVSCAQAAVQELRGRALAGRKLQVDFASRECQAHFFELVEREPSRSGGSSSSAAAAAVAASASIQQHRLSSLTPSAATPSSGRTARTPSCSSRSSTHSKERTGSSSSRSRHGGTLSRDESLERDTDMKDLTLDRDSAEYHHRRCASSRSPSPVEKDITTSVKDRYLRRTSIEPAETVGSPLVERERTRRYGSGGSSSSSGLSMDTGLSGPPPLIPSTNGSDVFSRIRDLSEEERGEGALSSGEEDEEEGAVSDLDGNNSSSRKSTSSSSKKAHHKKAHKKKKSKLSGSSDSGVSDVSTNEPLPPSHPLQSMSASSAQLTSSSQSGTTPSSTPTREAGKNSTSGGASASTLGRPSRRVSRLSTDSSGEGASSSKHSLPRIIPWEVETPQVRKNKAADGGNGSRPGTPLCDESGNTSADEMPTDPRSRDRPSRLTDRPMSLPLPRFALELCLSNPSRMGSIVTSSSKSTSSTVVTPSSSSSTDGTFRIPHPHGTSVSPSRASAATAVPGSPRGAAPDLSSSSHPPHLMDSSSDSECSSGSSPQRTSLSTAAVSLAEQLRQWEQRYEQWSTRSNHPASGCEGLPVPPGAIASPTLLTAGTTIASGPSAVSLAAERYRIVRKPRPMSLEELKSQEPSDIVRCLLAKHSVFDEDLKRLESSGRESSCSNTATPTTPSAVAHAPVTPTLTAAVANNKESISKNSLTASVPVVNHVSVPSSTLIQQTVASSNSSKIISTLSSVKEVSTKASSSFVPTGSPIPSVVNENSSKPKTPPLRPSSPLSSPPTTDPEEESARPPSPSSPIPSLPPPLEPVDATTVFRKDEKPLKHSQEESMETDDPAVAEDDDQEGNLVIVAEEEEDETVKTKVSAANEGTERITSLTSGCFEEERKEVVTNLLPPPPPPPPVLPAPPPPLPVAVAPVAVEPELPPPPPVVPELAPVTVETATVATPVVEASSISSSVKPPRVKHSESHSSSSSKSSSRDSKSGERSRHTSSSSSSHRKDKSSSVKHHTDREAKDSKTDNSVEAASNHLARRKSRESGEQQSTGSNDGSQNNGKRRRSIDASTGVPSSSKRPKSEKSEKSSDVREKDKEKDKVKTHDKENKETPTSATPKVPKSESKRESSSTTTSSSKTHSSSPASSVISSKKKDSDSSIKVSKSHREDDKSKTSSSKSSSSKSSSSKKDKDRSEKDRTRDKEKKRDEEREVERKKRSEEERSEKKKEEEPQKLREHKDKIKNQHSPASATGSSTSHRRRSDGDRGKPTQSSKPPPEPSQPPVRKSNSSQSQRSSTSSRKKSHSDSDSSDSSQQSETERRPSSSIRGGGLGGSKASSDDDDSDSDGSNDGSDYSPSKADRSLAAFLENEPTYFSMYDKVKARSLKLQQQKRQEEEKKSIQQQQQDKFCALRQARIAAGVSSKRDKDGKKINAWDTSDSSDSEGPICPNRPRPMATASLLSSNSGKLSSSSSSSSSEDSEPTQQHHSSRSNKSKDFLFDHPTESKHQSSKSTSKSSSLHSTSGLKSKPIISSSDSESEPEVKPMVTNKIKSKDTSSAASVSKRRPSAPEINHKSAPTEVSSSSKKIVERSHSTALPSKKSKKESSSKMLHHSSSCGAPPKLSSRGEEKMETIFGPLSDDSDDQQTIKSRHPTRQESSSSSRLQVAMVYSSDSDAPVAPTTNHVRTSKLDSGPPISPSLDNSGSKTEQRSDKRKKKSKESRSRDRKKSGSKEATSETLSSTPAGSNHHHHHRSSKTSEEILEASRALESKLVEDSLIAIANLAVQKEKEKEAELQRSSVSVEHIKSKKKKKKSSKTHRDAESHHQSVVALVKTEPSSPLPPATPLHIKTEPTDIFSAAPVASSSPRVPSSKSSKADSIEVEPKLMSMPSLWEPSATSSTPSLPPPLVSVDQPKPVQKVAAPRPAIWKQETEDAVAGLLLETFDDFKMETLDQVDEPVEVIPQGLLRGDDEHPSPPEGEEQSPPQPNEEALKAIQSLQCEDDLDLSGEMIIDSEAGTSSTEDTPAPTDGPLYSGSSSSDAVEMAVRLNNSAGSGSEKPGVVETAPTPPPSPPELCIDETRCTQPVDGNDSSSQSPRKEGGIMLNRPPRTPDVDLSKSPRTPRTPDVRPSTPDLPPFAHPNHKTEMMTAVQQQSSPAKRGRKPNPVAPSNRGGRGRGRGRPPGSSRGVSESSVEGHDADVYEFNDMEEEGTVATATTTATPTAPVTTTVVSVAHAAVPTTVNLPDTEHLQIKTQPSEPEKVFHPEGNHEAQKKDLEGLKGRLMFEPARCTTIDDTIEHVVRGVAQHQSAAHQHMMIMAGVAAPSSPRGTVRGPPVTSTQGLVHLQPPTQRTTIEPFTTTTGPAVMKVELPQPLLKEQQQPSGSAATSVEAIPAHLNSARRPCYDEPPTIPSPSTQAGGLPVRRPEEISTPLSSSPSTVVLNLRSGSGHQQQSPLSAPQTKVPSPKLAVITTSTSGQPHPLLSSSSSVTITPTAPAAGPPASTVIQTQQQQQSATGTSAEVARLPSATVVTPVPAKTPASGPSYPAVPLTRDAPPHGLVLQQQQQMQMQQQQHQHQQAQQKQSQQQNQATPSAQQQQAQSQQQQHSSHPPQLPLPAGVPVSLSGGATVIAVASNGRVSGPPPLIGRQTVVTVPHSLTQNQPTMPGSTVVIARSVGPPQQQSVNLPPSRVLQQQHPAAAPSPLQAQQQRPPPAVVTLYSTGGFSQQQSTGGIASVASSTRPPVTTTTGSSVSVLPATSRPPLSASTSSSGGGVSVYPIYGPRAELTPVTQSSAAAPPFGSPLTSTPVRVTVSNSSSSTGGRATISQAQVVTTPATGAPAYSRQPAYPPNEPPAHHYAAAYHHLSQQQQHSPNVAPAEPPRQQSNTPARDDMDRGVGPTSMAALHHPHLLPRELPTPPPAHQHSPVQQPADLSRVVTPSQMMQHHQHQQLMYQQFIRAQQLELARMGGTPYSPAPPQHGQEGLGERDRVAIQSGTPAPPSSIPLHLRNLAAGGEHRATESPLQASAAVPFSSVGGNTQTQQHYAHHRPGSGSSGYPTSATGHLLAPPSPSSHHHRNYAPEELTSYHPSPPPAHHGGGGGPGRAHPTPGCEAPNSNSAALVRPPAIRTPPHASQVPPQGDSLVMLLQRFPIMWQGLMALKNDHAVVQMHFISGNPLVARGSLPCTPEGHALPLRIAQRMRLEQQQLEGVARKVQMEQEHCILLALPCGRDAMDVLLQSNNLRQGFITYLQLKQAAGIVNVVTGPQGYSDASTQQPSYVVHIFPACEFANETLARITPDLLHRVTDIAHLLVVIATV